MPWLDGPPTYRCSPAIVNSTGMLTFETVLGLNFHVRTVLRTDLSSSGLPVLCAIEALVMVPLAGSTETTQTPLPAMRCERASCGYSGRGAEVVRAFAAEGEITLPRGTGAPCAGFVAAGLADSCSAAKPCSSFAAEGEITLSSGTGGPCAGFVAAGLADSFCSAKPGSSFGAEGEITLSSGTGGPCAGFVAAGLADSFCSAKPCSSFVAEGEITLSSGTGGPCAGFVA